MLNILEYIYMQMCVKCEGRIQTFNCVSSYGNSFTTHLGEKARVCNIVSFGGCANVDP